jgi:predicted nucleic acid-binding protein
MVLVDTSVWIEAFRTGASQERRELDRLLAAQEVSIVGPVLAELLQGARRQQEFDALRRRLSALDYASETSQSWAMAGNLSYRLREGGATVGLVDLLIATLAIEHGHELYTLDRHFQHIPGLQLYSPQP